jgi:hypothetical protein
MYRYLYLASPPIIVCFVMLGVVFAVNLVMCIMNGIAYASMAIFAMCVIVLFVLFFRYHSAVQTGRKRFAEDTNNKGAITVTATLTDEELISEASDREKPIIVPYSEFRKVYVTKTYYILQAGEGMVYVFRKGCFETGDENAFLPCITQIIENNKRKR